MEEDESDLTTDHTPPLLPPPSASAELSRVPLEPNIRITHDLMNESGSSTGHSSIDHSPRSHSRITGKSPNPTPTHTPITRKRRNSEEGLSPVNASPFSPSSSSGDAIGDDDISKVLSDLDNRQIDETLTKAMGLLPTLVAQDLAVRLGREKPEVRPNRASDRIRHPPNYLNIKSFATKKYWNGEIWLEVC